MKTVQLSEYELKVLKTLVTNKHADLEYKGNCKKAQEKIWELFVKLS